MTTKGSLGNNYGDGNENGKKSNKFILVKQQLRASHFFFAHFLAIVAASRHVELPYITRPLYGVGKHNTKKFLFLFLNSCRCGPFEFTPENFASIWQIKWTWIRSMKFETVRIHFLSVTWIFSLLSSKNFATMAMWRNDFSSLFPFL